MKSTGCFPGTKLGTPVSRRRDALRLGSSRTANASLCNNCVCEQTGFRSSAVEDYVLTESQISYFKFQIVVWFLLVCLVTASSLRAAETNAPAASPTTSAP